MDQNPHRHRQHEHAQLGKGGAYVSHACYGHGDQTGHAHWCQPVPQKEKERKKKKRKKEKKKRIVSSCTTKPVFCCCFDRVNLYHKKYFFELCQLVPQKKRKRKKGLCQAVPQNPFFVVVLIVSTCTKKIFFELCQPVQQNKKNWIVSSCTTKPVFCCFDCVNLYDKKKKKIGLCQAVP